MNNRISVSEFRSILNFNRNSCKFFKDVFSYQTCMPRSSASNYKNPFSINELLKIILNTCHLNHSFTRQKTSSVSIFDYIWLLMDFLKHEMIVTFFFDLL